MAGSRLQRGMSGAKTPPRAAGFAPDNPAAFLSATCARVWSAHDADDCLQRFAQALVPSLADWCVVEVGGGTVAHRLVVARTSHPGSLPTVAIVPSVPGDLPASSALEALLQRVWHTGMPYAFSAEQRAYAGGTTVTDSGVAAETAAETADELSGALQAMGVGACLSMPMRVGDRAVGAVLLCSRRPDLRYDSATAALTEILASITAAAFEHLRLQAELAGAESVLANTQTELAQAYADLDRARAGLEQARADQARAEERLQTERAVCTAIANSVGDGLLIVDKDGRLQYANPVAQAELGWTEAEMKGQTPEAVLQVRRSDATGRQAAFCSLMGVLDTGVPCPSHEQVFIRRTGSPLHVTVAATPIKDKGEVIGAVIAFRNITCLKETQRRVEQLSTELEELVPLRTAELVEANRELEAFAYSVSHDLRTPLRTINGFSQALLEDYGDQLDDTARDYIRRLKAASERMGELIDALLSLARVTQAELVREEVDLSRMASSIAGQLQQGEPCRYVEFHIQPGLKTRGDRRLLQIVLENLLGNAWKFTRRCPRAVIEVGETDVDGRRVFFVRDNGIGFDMRYVDKLFGAFQRLHPRDEFEGTGIGLATVQRIIRRHGGSIWGVGVVEGGATFYFTIEQGDVA